MYSEPTPFLQCKRRNNLLIGAKLFKWNNGVSEKSNEIFFIFSRVIWLILSFPFQLILFVIYQFIYQMKYIFFSRYFWRVFRCYFPYFLVLLHFLPLENQFAQGIKMDAHQATLDSQFPLCAFILLYMYLFDSTLRLQRSYYRFYLKNLFVHWKIWQSSIVTIRFFIIDNVLMFVRSYFY